ncbi:hypothetical protein [Streptomyces sp. A1547]|uniref:SseB protein N-terminal domain-containing protein n=1 Tax=Streptomyces sp. R33 TaxID=3238629 RepID=A0AB39Y054_9ACTN|nr:hypothetical protein [Streptomyces sp. A1547]
MDFDEEWAGLRTAAERAATKPQPPSRPEPEPPVAPVPTPASAPETAADTLEMAREAVLERLADFRSRVLLVPLDERDGLWTGRFGGLDWIYAFSGDEQLARFAQARGEQGKEWPYRRVVGARILDEVVPALDFPCGVAWDVAGPDGMVFPPLSGFVPERAALDGEVAR